MPRPRTPIGSHGAVKFDTFDDRALPVRARTRYRGADGRYRQVERWATSRAAAQVAISSAVREAMEGRAIRVAKPADFSPAMRVDRLVELFLADAERHKSSATYRSYTSVLGKHVAPKDRLGVLTLGELTTAALQSAVDSIPTPGARVNVRRALSTMLAFAVRNGGLGRNPAAGVTVRKAKAVGSGRDRVFVPKERLAEFLDAASAHPGLLAHDGADAVAILALVGLRAGELCGLRWVDVDLIAGTVTVEATATRAPVGKGAHPAGPRMLRQDRPKTAASNRTLALPARALAILQARHEAMQQPDPESMIFPAERGGGVRAPDRVASVLARAVDDLGYPGLTPHGLRRTTATILNAAGLSSRDIADYLGHERTDITEAHYIQRTVGAARSAAAINTILDSA